MKGIKTILTFLFSAVYTSCIWLLFVLPTKSGWVLAPIIFLILSSTLMLLGGATWLAEHWDD